ncbi:hypothetical protein BDW22DRAFT_1361302 [Trametopsis cervina]|nr:hypothetical protein BDW22DRAFT_1361302 [Trametopsis cervina]
MPSDERESRIQKIHLINMKFDVLPLSRRHNTERSGLKRLHAVYMRSCHHSQAISYASLWAQTIWSSFSGGGGEISGNAQCAESSTFIRNRSVIPAYCSRTRSNYFRPPHLAVPQVMLETATTFLCLALPALIVDRNSAGSALTALTQTCTPPVVQH